MANHMFKMGKFVSDVSDLIVKKCCIAMFDNDINIDSLVIYS